MTINFGARLLEHAYSLVAPLSEAVKDDASLVQFFGTIGWRWDENVIGIPTNRLLQVLGKLKQTANELSMYAEKNPDDLWDVVQAIQNISSGFLAFQALRDEWNPPHGLNRDLLETLAKDLLRALLDAHMLRSFSTTTAVFDFIGITTKSLEDAICTPNGQVIREARLRTQWDIQALSDLLNDPPRFARERILENEIGDVLLANAVADRVGPIVARSLRTLGVSAHYGTPGLFRFPDLDDDARETAQHLLHVAWCEPSADGQTTGLSMSAGLADLGSGLALVLLGGANVRNSWQRGYSAVNLCARASAGIVIRKDGIDVLEGESSPGASFNVSLDWKESSAPVARLGSEGGTHLQIGETHAEFALTADASGPKAEALLRAIGIELCLMLDRSDGFISAVFPKSGIIIPIELELEWSSKTGFGIHGKGPGTCFEIPLDLNILDVLHLVRFRVSLMIGERIRFEASVDAALSLGPLHLSVEGLGLQASLNASKDSGLGKFELALRPPMGIAISLETGPIVGGGYLYFDEEKQEYTGALQLEIAEKLSVSAFGLLTTKMPDGSPGYSLLILIATEFASPIQLGYGFTLSGVGGLVGANRTAATEALRAGLRTGTLGSLLFPNDAARNAPQIVSDLGTVFPPAQGRYVFGPMVRLGWGTPNLLKLDLAVILELPEPVRLLLLGRLSVVLPNERDAVVRLQLDSFGTYNFDNGDVALDAVLFDSEVAGFPVTGEMALRASFGDRPHFALAIGGFHPSFPVPSGFPALQRTSISLSNDNNPRLLLAAYLAITTNTVQFGAEVDLYAKTGPFSIEGNLGFDVLIHFDPFGLAATLDASVALKCKGKVLTSVMLDMNLTGPSPWHAWGKARFHLLFVSGSVHFDKTIGRDSPPPRPAQVELRPLLEIALREPGNWAAQLPPGEHPLVTLCDSKGSTENLVLIHPLAELQVNQRVMPLDFEIMRFGNTFPAKENKFNLEVVDFQDHIEPTTAYFAPAQFMEMSDQEKLCAPSFQKLTSGIRFGVRGFEYGEAVTNEMGYEEHFLSTTSRRELTSTRVPGGTAGFVERVASRGPAGKSQLRTSGRAKYRSPSVEGEPAGGFRLKKPLFSVADLRETAGAVRTAKAVGIAAAASDAVFSEPVGPAVFHNYASALNALHKHLEKNPEDRAWLRVASQRRGSTS